MTDENNDTNNNQAEQNMPNPAGQNRVQQIVEKDPNAVEIPASWTIIATRKLTEASFEGLPNQMSEELARQLKAAGRLQVKYQEAAGRQSLLVRGMP